MKKTFLVFFGVCLLVLAVGAAKSHLSLSVSSTYTGEPATAIVTDKTTGLPVENVGLEIFADEVTPITRVFYCFTDASGQTEPYTIDSPGTYIFTLDNADYFYEEISVVYVSPLPEYQHIWFMIILMFLPLLVYYAIRNKKRI